MRFSQLQGQLRAPPAVVIGQLVAGDAKQPGGKAALPAEAVDGLQRGQEGLGGQVLSLLNLPGARQVITVHTRQVALVQLAEGIGVAGGAAGQLGIPYRSVAVSNAGSGKSHDQGERRYR